MNINLSNLFVSLMASFGTVVAIFIVLISVFGNFSIEFPWYLTLSLLVSIGIFFIFFIRVINSV